MSLSEDAAGVLSRGRIDADVLPAGRPRPIALDRVQDLGTVLFVIDVPDDTRRALYGIYVWRAGAWEEQAVFGAPWPVAGGEDEHDSYVVARGSICGNDRSAVVFVAHVAPGVDGLELVTDGRRKVSIGHDGGCAVLLTGRALECPARLEAAGRALIEFDWRGAFSQEGHFA